MNERLSPTEFWEVGIEITKLDPDTRGAFVIKLLDSQHEPPRVLVAQRQPGHEIAVLSQPMRHVHHPQSSAPNRYYGIGVARPEPIETMRTIIQNNHPTHEAATLLGVS